MSHTPGKTHTRAGSVYWKGLAGPGFSRPVEEISEETREEAEEREEQRVAPQQPTDRNIKGLSVILAAEQSLDHAKKVLAETMAAKEINFLTFSERDDSYQGSQKEVVHCLQQLTYARTYWTMQMIEHSNEWREGTWFKYGVKDKITYRKGNYMLSVSTIDDGHPHEWKMDLVGGPTLQPLKHPSADTLKTALDAIAKRIRAYHGYLESNYRSSKRHRAHDDPERHKKRQDAEEYSLGVFTDLLTCIEASMKSNGAQTTGFTAVQELGAMFWSDLDPDFRATDKDSDVTYDPQKGFHSSFEAGVENDGHVEAGVENDGHIKVDVYWRKPARRKWGVHVELENSKTINFINRVLPYVSDGWMEIVIKGFKRTFHMKLLPWQEPKTTYVQPFWMTSDINKWGAQETADVQSIMAKTFQEFRDIPTERWQIHMGDPYLISGKGSEIDAMVQSINSMEHDERELLIEACEIWQKNLNSKDHSDATSISEVWIETLKDIRAYFSTDVNKKHGDRSVFFFHIKGFIFGVEMLSPSIPYINLQYDHPIRTLPPRGEQSAGIIPGEHSNRHRGGSRGRHSEDDSPRPRRQSSTPPGSRGGSRGRAPHPQAQDSGVTQALFDQLERLQRFVHALEEKQQHNTAKAPENQVDVIKLMEERFKELQKNLEQQSNAQQSFSGDSEITTSFNEANGGMVLEDPAGEWLVAVSKEHPEQAPLEIHAWGMFDNFETQKFTEDNAVVFYLDREQAEMNGTLLYTTFKNRLIPTTGRKDSNFALFPYAFHKDGYQTMQYAWLMQYLINDPTQKKEYKMDKVKHSTTLVSSEGERWKANKDLVDLDTREEKRIYYKVYFRVNTKQGTVQRHRNWMTMNQNTRVRIIYNFTAKQFEIGRHNIIDKRFDPQTLVNGIAGHKYWLQMFPEYRAMPNNDKSGVLPKNISMEVNKLTLVLKGGAEKIFDDMTFNFTLMDCKQPMYFYYLQHEEKDIVLYLGPYFDDHKQGYSWGIKSTCGKDMDPIWIAYLPHIWETTEGIFETNRSNLFDCSLDDTSRTMRFWRWIDGTKVTSIQEQDIWFRIPREEVVQYRRLPNVPNPNVDNDPRKNELKGEFIPFQADSLNQIFPVMDAAMLKRVLTTWRELEENALLGKFGLFIYEKNFPGYLNRTSNKTGVPVDVSMAPRFIIMEHDHLSGRMAEENRRLQLVDVQGPVWVSKSGYYMISPHRDGKKDERKCWALFYWNKQLAAYCLFATKLSDHLVSTPEYDKLESLSSDWTFYRQWDGKPITNGINSRLTVTMEFNTNARNITKDGRKIKPNYYSLFKRMPDFRIEKTEAQIIASRRFSSLNALFLGTQKISEDDLVTDRTNKTYTQEELIEMEKQRVQRETALRHAQDARELARATGQKNKGLDINDTNDFPSLSEGSKQSIQQSSKNIESVQSSLDIINQELDSIQDAEVTLRPATRGAMQQGTSKYRIINLMKKTGQELASDLVAQQKAEEIEKYMPKEHAQSIEEDIREHITKELQTTFTENQAAFADDRPKYDNLKQIIINFTVKHFMRLFDQRKIAHEREKGRAEDNERRFEELKEDLRRKVMNDFESMRGDDFMNDTERQNDLEKRLQDVDRRVEMEKELLEQSAENTYGTVELIPYSFQRQTPWLDIMDNYRAFLMAEPGRKNKKKRDYIERTMRQNETRANEAKAREEANRKEQEIRQKQKEALLEKKKVDEDNFYKKFDGKEPEEKSEDYMMLQKCRVFKEQSNWRKVPLELKEVKIGDSYFNFELISPYKMHYVAKTKQNHPELVLMPEMMQNDKNENVYAWKLMLMKDSELIEDGKPAPKVTVAVKWQQPEVLIDDYDNAWRWRFQSIPNIKLTNSDIIRELAKAEGHINYVWYKGMQFTKTQEILRDDLLPTFILQHSGVHTQTTEAYIYSTSLQSAIYNERFWASIWPSSELRKNCLSFFEVPVYLYVTLATGRDTQTFQLNSVSEDDTTVPRMQKNTPYDFTDHFCWYNTTNRGYFTMKLYADDELNKWVLAVEKDGEYIPVLIKIDKFLCNTQNNRWTKAREESSVTKKSKQEDFWKYINFVGESNLTVKTTQSQRFPMKIDKTKDGTCARYWAFHMFDEIEGASKFKYIRENAGDFDFQRAAAALQAGWQSDAEEDLDLHPDDRFTVRPPIRSSAASSLAAWSSGPSSQTTELEVQLLPLQSRRQSAALKLTAQRAAALKLAAQPCPKSLAPARPLLVNRFPL